MRTEKITSPVWANADHTAITCLVKFSQYSKPLPFTASKRDSEAHGREIFAACVKGEAGKIGAYRPPVIDTVAQAERKKAQLLSEIKEKTALWRSQLALDMLSESGKAELRWWMLYAQAVEAVNVTKPVWPERPE